MRQFLVLVIVGVLAWKGYETYNSRLRHDETRSAPDRSFNDSVPLQEADNLRDTNFHCDGRQYCSQMHSCAEATYFLQNCPNVKMDGDRNGVPCERQWCN